MTTTLLIGNTNDDGDYYVKLADNNGVYTMSESTLDKLLNVDVLDYVSMYLNDVPMTNMKSLEVTYQGETKTLTVESEEAPVETEASTEEETEADTIKISAVLWMMQRPRQRAKARRKPKLRRRPSSRCGPFTIIW